MDLHRSKQAKTNLNLNPNLAPLNNPSTKKLKLKLKATSNNKKKE
jgi:hypothetical protein